MIEISNFQKSIHNQDKNPHNKADNIQGFYKFPEVKKYDFI